jgi:hypothetical protein
MIIVKPRQTSHVVFRLNASVAWDTNPSLVILEVGEEVHYRPERRRE